MITLFRSGLDSSDRRELRDFIKANLRAAIQNEPENEEEVQDQLESILIGRGYQKGDHYDRESGRVKTGPKEHVPDFVFYNLDLALEVKFLPNKPRLKEAIDEINADIEAYGQEYDNVLIVVYDIGCIQDVEEFRQGIDAQVVVVKH